MDKGLLKIPKDGVSYDLKKADIFSFGITIYELLVQEQNLPKNG